MSAARTYAFAREEIVELLRFKSLQQGHDPQDDPVFRTQPVVDRRRAAQAE